MAAANNILVLMSDEHTRSVMGAYGNELAHTPVLDDLAARGVRFENAYTPSPICIPTCFGGCDSPACLGMGTTARLLRVPIPKDTSHLTLPPSRQKISPTRL